MPSTPRYAWLDGAIVPWEGCVLHARTQGAFWGANVFEGVRAYWRPAQEQLSMFRLEDHLGRLRRSMKFMRMEIGYSDDELREACLQLLRANEFREHVHVVIVAYFGMGESFDPLHHTDDAGAHITAVSMPRLERYRHGVSACISSWRRISDDTMPPRVKAGANYQNSRLAQQEAARNGYDTTLILNQRGTVAEAPGACVVMVRDGRLVTPPGTSGVLEGITVATIAEIVERELGLDVEQREIDRTELQLADEVFLCGTLAEILPIVAIDRLPIATGAPGPLTRRLQNLYDRATQAERWTTPVYPTAAGLPYRRHVTPPP